MKEIKLSLNNVENIKVFVQRVNKFPFDLDIKSRRYIIDAKSIMGLFSLNLAEPIYLICSSEHYDEVKEAVKEWIVD